MALAAKDHCQDLGMKGKVSKNGAGSDGTSYLERLNRYGDLGSAISEDVNIYQRPNVKEMMIQLLLEEVPNSASDPSIWNSSFKKMGLAACTHASMGNLMVLLLAEEFEENEATQKILENWVDNRLKDADGFDVPVLGAHGSAF